MSNDLNQPIYVKDEIDLNEIIKILFDYKKLIALTVLIFTIASIIYAYSLKPSFKTSTKLEIGFISMLSGERDLIELPSSLISDLKVLTLKNPDNKFSQSLSMDLYEDKIIILETTSDSAEQNENTLTEITEFILDRHSNLALKKTNHLKNELSHKIEKIKSETSFIRDDISLRLEKTESEILFVKEKMQVDYENQISKLKTSSSLIDKEIIGLEQLVIEGLNSLQILKDAEKSLEIEKTTISLNQTISTYKSRIISLKRQKELDIIDLKILSETLDDLKNNILRSDQLFRLEEKKKDLEHYSSNSAELFMLEVELSLNENKLQNLMTQSLTMTSPIGDIKTEIIKPKTQLIIFLGFIFGFFASMLLVFIIKLTKSLRVLKE